MDTATEAPAQEISFGGVIWKKDENSAAGYKSLNEAKEEMAVSQYPEDGRWHWRTDLYKTFNDVKLATLYKHVSGIVADRDTAMMCCLDGKAILLSDITQMLIVLMPDSQYAQGFRDGQEDIKAKVAEVVL